MNKNNILYDHYYHEIVTQGRWGTLSELTKKRLFNYAFSKACEKYGYDGTKEMYEELQDMVEDIVEAEIDARALDEI